MGRPNEVVALLSRFEQMDFDENIDTDELATDLDRFFSSDQSSKLLKQKKNDSLFAVMRLFLKVVLAEQPKVYKPLVKHFDVVLELLRSRLPSFKKASRWQKFEIEFLARSIPKLTERITVDDSWVEIWCFMAHILVTEGGQTPPLNALLGVAELAFKKGKDCRTTIEQAWTCWTSLVAALRNSPTFIASRRLSLLMKPLTACHVVSKGRISTWLLLIEVHLNSSDENLKKCVEPFFTALYKSKNAVSRHLPDDCADALVRLLTMSPVRQTYLENMIVLFKDVLDSKLSENACQKLCSSFISAINDCEDDAASFDYWKSLIDQCSPRGNLFDQARLIFCQSVNYSRWFENVKIDKKTILNLMEYLEFRKEILLPTIKTLSKLSDSESTVAKKKSNVFIADWFGLCDLYISWGEQRDADAFDKSSDSCDRDAFLALLLHPFQNYSWNPLIANAWHTISQFCHERKILKPMMKQIFDAAGGSTFHVQRAIDVLLYVCRFDNSLPSMSTNVLEKIAAQVDSIDVKSLNDLLYMIENVSAITEIQPVLITILKSMNDISNSTDDNIVLRMKVAKIYRKMEPLNNLSDAEQTNNKPQRAPFRAQSNFQHRLSKAEEKKKFRTSLGSSRTLFNLESNKIDMDSSENNLNLLHDEDETSPKMQIDTAISPSTKLLSLEGEENSLKRSQEPDEEANRAIVAEKENLNIRNEPSLPSSPLLHSPANKVKIPNARDMKIADSQSPTVKMKLNSDSPLTLSPSLHSPGSKMRITNAREVKVADGQSPNMKVKPLAGQKSPATLKIPAPKVSYFDDDASDYVMVPPKLKITPLTEHQKEKMSRRRSDIPALYQDLSQDTQLSANSSNVVIQESQGSEKDSVVISGNQSLNSTQSNAPSPDSPSQKRKSGHSAKRLDFNSPCSIQESSAIMNNLKNSPDGVSICVNGVGKTSPDHSLEKKTSAVSCDSESDFNPSDIPSAVHLDAKQDEEIVSSSILDSSIPDPKTDGVADDNTASLDIGSGKKKRKRKSEPNKFSPKLTRSRKNKNQSTPSATESTVVNEEEIALNKKARIDVTEEGIALSKKDQIDSTAENEPSQEMLPVVIASENMECNLVQEDGRNSDETLSQRDSPVKNSVAIVEQKSSTQEDITTPKSTKKYKPSSEESAAEESKKSCSSKKKKKLFRLTPNNNKLENWLIRQDKVEKESSPISSLTTTNEVEQIEKDAIPAAMECEPLANNVEDDSEDIVPGTQDVSTPTSTPVLAIIQYQNVIEDQSKQLETGESTVKSAENNETGKTDELEPNGIKDNNKPVMDQNVKLKTESPGSDDIELIITSPTLRGKRASSVARGEGESKEELATENILDEWSPKRARRNKIVSSPMKNTRLGLHPAGGRSAKMLRLAVASNSEDGKDLAVTPIRRRESIIPQTYGENWPKGPTQDWIARTPGSPFMSPSRSTLKKTPARDEETTPQRRGNESFGSPLLSSLKKKRVKFFDPPVTTGLLTYEDGRGALHLADVPPTTVLPYCEFLDSQPLAPAQYSPPLPNAPDPYEEGSSSAVEDLDLVLEKFKQRFKLDAAFMEEFTKLTLRIQGILFACFNSSSMQQTVDDLRFAEYKLIRNLPYSLLHHVRNVSKENLIEVLDLKPKGDTKLVQTNPLPVLQDKQTHTFVPVSPVVCQTDSPVMVSMGTTAAPTTRSVSSSVQPSTASVGTSACPLMEDISTQASLNWPSDDDLRLLVERDGFARTLQTVVNCLSQISKFAPE